MATTAGENATLEEPPIAAADQPSKQPPPISTNTAAANIEFEPPAACIRRLLKAALPKSTNVSKDSLAAISRASGIFVLYLTACANDVAREGRRTTIVAKDVLAALKELDFEEFVPLMEKFLEGHRKEEKSKKEEKERLKKQQQLQDKSHPEKDGTTGKFVGKDDGGNKEEGDGEDEESANAAGDAKHGRDDDDDDEDDNDEEEKVNEPLAKKPKVDEDEE